MNKDEQIAKLQDLIDIQCENGNWDYSPYMFGMANGLIMAMSLLTESDPKFLEKPDVFLYELTELDKFNNSSIIVDNIKKAND